MGGIDKRAVGGVLISLAGLCFFVGILAFLLFLIDLFFGVHFARVLGYYGLEGINFYGTVLMYSALAGLVFMMLWVGTRGLSEKDKSLRRISWVIIAGEILIIATWLLPLDGVRQSLSSLNGIGEYFRPYGALTLVIQWIWLCLNVAIAACAFYQSAKIAKNRKSFAPHVLLTVLLVLYAGYVIVVTSTSLDVFFFSDLYSPILLGMAFAGFATAVCELKALD